MSAQSFTFTPRSARYSIFRLFAIVIIFLFSVGVSTDRAFAQWQFSTLYSFSGYDGGNSDAKLMQGIDGSLYGTTIAGGLFGQGTVFRISPAGSLTILHSFDLSDGSEPSALVQGSNGVLYGICESGGRVGKGTLFAMTTDGTLLWDNSFAGAPDGAHPEGPLVIGLDGNIYGTTTNGGSNNLGTVFRSTSDGARAILYSFTGASDGAYPRGLSLGYDGFIYGESSGGASSETDYGTLFQLDSDENLQTIYTFTGLQDEGAPMGGLTPTPEGLYGTALSGTDVYSLTEPDFDGSVFLYSGSSLLSSLFTFIGGANGEAPEGGVILGQDGNLYGTTTGQAPFGNSDGDGTIFRLTPAGVLTTLHSFGGQPDGSDPVAGLCQAANGSIYGIANFGGASNWGTIFCLSQPGSGTRFAIHTPTTAQQGQPVTVTVTAVDNLGNTVTAYSGTLHFTSTDEEATLPSDAALQNGFGSFSVTFRTPGSQTLDATDTQISGISGASNAVTVSGGPAPGSVPIHTYGAGLQMISAPADFFGSPLSQIFSDPSLIMAVWNPVDSQYVISPTIPADTIRMGQAYWVRFKQSTALYGDGAGAIPGMKDGFNMLPGWNMVADPYFTTVPLSSLQILVGSPATTYTFSQAVAAGIVSPTLYTYPAGATSYQTESSNLQPYVGYWMLANRGCIVQIPASVPSDTASE